MIRKKAAASKQTAKQTPAAGRAAASVVDLETVRALARIATELDLAEVEADATGRIRICRRVAALPVAFPTATAVPQAPSLSLVSGDKDKSVRDDLLVISSPFVGTFYRSPNPDSPSFADVGTVVRKGQVVCIVEAMKLMNEIESDFDGKIVEILVKNAEHVEYGQPLFRIEKS